VPTSAVAQTVVVPYNEVPDLDDDVAASSSSRSPQTWVWSRRRRVPRRLAEGV
jgi:hypothetical protein